MTVFVKENIILIFHLNMEKARICTILAVLNIKTNSLYLVDGMKKDKLVSRHYGYYVYFCIF